MSTPHYLKGVRAPAKLQIRVLCFGASITAGWSSGGAHYTPYSIRLSARLADGLPTSRFSIDVDGAPGDTVLRGQYMNRMETDMNSVKVTYDWVIIQAGGNDLAWKNTPEAIFEGLKAVWDVPLTAGAKVMALTVTEHANSSDRMKQKLESLNSLILNYQRDGFYTADLAKAIPWTGMDETERERIWDDGVHLTKEGYELMGDTIADRLIDIIKPPGMLEPMYFAAPLRLKLESDRESKM